MSEILDNMFDETTVPIIVMDVEHHSKVWLHSHAFYELVYIDKGFAMHVCDQTNTVLTSGDFFLIRPGQVHSYLSAYHTRLYNCLFSSEILHEELSDLSKYPGISHLFNKNEETKWEKLCLDMMERREVILFLEKIKWERLNQAIGWEIKIKSLLTELLVLYSRLYSQRTLVRNNSAHLQYVYKALEFIEEHYSEEFLIKDIADAVGISSDYLSKHFKLMISISPIEYVKNFRIAKSMEMLKLTQKPVSEIAINVGFSDISHFSRQFKQVAGVSPTIFRKNETEAEMEI